MFSEPALLLALVAKELGNGEPANGLAHRIRFRGDHPGESGSHLGSEGHVAVALVFEVVELPDDFVAALSGIELERFQRWTIVLDESVSPRHITPDGHEVVADGELLGIKVAKSG